MIDVLINRGLPFAKAPHFVEKFPCFFLINYKSMRRILSNEFLDRARLDVLLAC